jgi:hypothetical protein
LGIDANTCKWILEGWKRGVSFQRTLTLGRQFCYLDWGSLQAILEEYSITPDDELRSVANGWADPLFRRLGAQQIEFLDISPYEGATILHDMSLPVPDSLHGRFDVVLDAGTLEHIFNFPTSISNCVRMLSEGGVFLGATPANNWCGHGFYQFSPDLFYRFFSKQNGCTVERLVICGTTAGAEWRDIPDALESGKALWVISNEPTNCLVRARKVAQSMSDLEFPQQGDYQLLWQNQIPHKYPIEAFAPAEDKPKNFLNDLQSLHDQIATLEQGKLWNEQQAENWRNETSTLKGTVEEQGRWIKALEEAKQWNSHQAENWRNEASSLQRVVEDQKQWIKALEEGKAWCEKQMYAWQKEAARHLETVDELNTRIAGFERSVSDKGGE